MPGTPSSIIIELCSINTHGNESIWEEALRFPGDAVPDAGCAYLTSAKCSKDIVGGYILLLTTNAFIKTNLRNS